MQILIPLRDPAGVGHWYMLVVKPKAKTAEIVDSYPEKHQEPRRKQWATNAVCEIVIESDILKIYGNRCPWILLLATVVM